jgi:hypothetical protein
MAKRTRIEAFLWVLLGGTFSIDSWHTFYDSTNFLQSYWHVGYRRICVSCSQYQHQVVDCSCESSTPQLESRKHMSIGGNDGFNGHLMRQDFPL